MDIRAAVGIFSRTLWLWPAFGREPQTVRHKQREDEAVLQNGGPLEAVAERDKIGITNQDARRRRCQGKQKNEEEEKREAR